MTERREINITNLVSQSNKLIESRYNLNLTEQRLILAMISMISPEDVLEIKNKDIYNEVKKITESIMTKVIKIKDPEGLLQINWISSARYNDDSGTVTLKFDPSLKPYLLNIKDNYTKFGITAKFRSFYTTRIYLLVKQYERIGKRVVLVDFLKELFPQYPAYKDIKRRILIPAQKEISTLSDIKFDFIEGNKMGRKVKEVIFNNIRSQSYTQELPLYPSPIKKEDNISKVINEKYGVELSIAEKIVSEVDSKESFSKIFKYIDSCIINQSIKNVPGFVVECIRKKYYEKEIKSKIIKNDDEYLEFKKKADKEEKIKLNNSDPFFLDLMEGLKSGNEEEYDKWLSKLSFVKKDKDSLILGTASKFDRDWIIREYLDEKIYPAVKSIDESVNVISIISIIKMN